MIEHQLKKVQAHFTALKNYHTYIKELGFGFSVDEYNHLTIEQKAVLEAYLKRFASLQDYLGAKVFKSLLDSAGISYRKMSDVLMLIENEGIIDLDSWIEFRNIRNDLEHDYPDELEEALQDARFCFENFETMQEIVKKVFIFARRFGANTSIDTKSDSGSCQ